MKIRGLILLSIFILILAACSPASPGNQPQRNTHGSPDTSEGAPGAAPLGNPVTVPPSATPQPPSETASPAVTATSTFTSTPNGPQATILAGPTNCQFGPDFGYQTIDILNTGQTVLIVGRDDNSNWLYIQDPNNTSVSCWVPAASVSTTGDVAGADVVMPPMGMITKVTMTASANSKVCPGANHIKFSATVTTSSWAVLEYAWVLTGPVDTVISGRLVINSGGPHAINGSFNKNLPCGVYKATLKITSPQTISITKTFAIP